MQLIRGQKLKVNDILLTKICTHHDMSMWLLSQPFFPCHIFIRIFFEKKSYFYPLSQFKFHNSFETLLLIKLVYKKQ